MYLVRRMISKCRRTCFPSPPRSLCLISDLIAFISTTRKTSVPPLTVFPQTLQTFFFLPSCVYLCSIFFHCLKLRDHRVCFLPAAHLSWLLFSVEMTGSYGLSKLSFTRPVAAMGLTGSVSQTSKPERVFGPVAYHPLQPQEQGHSLSRSLKFHLLVPWLPSV